MKQLFAGIMLLAASQMANAALVSFNGYTLDESTDIVTGGGLDWLQWDVTENMSIQDIDRLINDVNFNGMIGGVDYGTGWSIATNFDMANLFNDFVFGADVPWDTDENTSQRVSNRDFNVEDAANDPEKGFVSLFGNTNTEFAGNEGSADPIEFAAAWFGMDSDGDNRYNYASVFDDYLYKTNTFHNLGFAEISADGAGGNVRIPSAGVALVRTSTQPKFLLAQAPPLVPQPAAAPVAVSAPSVLTIMLAGVAFIFYRRKA